MSFYAEDDSFFVPFIAVNDMPTSLFSFPYMNHKIFLKYCCYAIHHRLYAKLLCEPIVAYGWVSEMERKQRNRVRGEKQSYEEIKREDKLEDW